jgi:hypothetical protein
MTGKFGMRNLVLSPNFDELKASLYVFKLYALHMFTENSTRMQITYLKRDYKEMKVQGNGSKSKMALLPRNTNSIFKPKDCLDCQFSDENQDTYVKILKEKLSKRSKQLMPFCFLKVCL